jgi:hypothetical protein
MMLDDFRNAPAEPRHLPAALRALWHAARGDWDEAHRIAQDVEDEAGAWVHAHLHRQEGDLSNAAYWYRRARQPIPSDSLALEWERIARTLLADSAQF